MQLANNLGTIIAAEEFCGLAFDRSAIETFIDERVDASDLSFANFLNTAVTAHKFGHKDMSSSQKAAHCRQISRVANSYKFVK